MDYSEITWLLLAIILTLLLYLYLNVRKTYKFWQNKGVAYMKPLPFIGNLWPVIKQDYSIGDLYTDAYIKFPNEKVVGIFETTKPVLVVRDPKLLERILVKDFNHFVDHGVFFPDGLFKNGLFQINGMQWRSLRYKMSPAFTSGKLKAVFNGMLDCTDIMVDLLKNNMNKDYEVKNALIAFTVDVIASTVFGIQINDIIARNEFAKRGMSVFNVNFSRYLQMLALTQFPKFAKLLRCRSMSEDTEQYFRKVIRQTFDQRINGDLQRNDYLNHLIKLKEKGVIEVQPKDEDDAFLELDSPAPPENLEITEEILVGQAFQFLTAGFDPLFNTMVFVMHDMCLFPETQEIARKEVKQVLKNNNGRYTYKAIKEMTYLEQCLQETFRLHSLTPFLFRICTKKYKTEFGLQIDIGQKIIIPLNGLHLDSKYYPNPNAYMPERHPPNTFKSNFTYLPFGDGPRMCIGLRFAIVELKLGLAKILDNFKFTLSPKTKIPLEMNKRSFILLPKDKVMFKLTPA